MQPYIFGEQKPGNLLCIPCGMLETNESVPGQLYEAHIQTQPTLGLGGTDKKDIVAHLYRMLPEQVPGLKLNWVRVEDTLIKIQFTGSPFPFALLLAALPEILSLIGITVSLIGVYLIWRKIPGSVLGVIAIGASLFYLAPTLSRLMRKAVESSR